MFDFVYVLYLLRITSYNITNSGRAWLDGIGSKKYGQWINPIKIQSLITQVQKILIEFCNITLLLMRSQCILGQPDFLTDLADTFFWLPWGMYEWPWRGFGSGWSFSVVVRAFCKIIWKILILKNFIKRSHHNRKRPPRAKSSSGPLMHTPMNPKKGVW